MEEKVKVLVERLKIEERYFSYFKDAKINRIVASTKNSTLTFFITIEDYLPVELLEQINEVKNHAFKDIESTNILFEVTNYNDDRLKEYFNSFIDTNYPSLEYFKDHLIIENNDIKIEVSNQAEKLQFSNCLEKLEQFLFPLGYKNDIEVFINEEKREEVQKEIHEEKNAEPIIVEKPKEEIKEKPERKTKTSDNPNVVLGRNINQDPTTITNVVGEDNNIILDVYVFGSDYFESSKTDFKIITLKITDYSDSMYCKVFVRDDEEYGRLKKELKPGNWFRIRGYTKNDTFAKELVLNARDILKLDKVNSVRFDDSDEKRLELHTHTKMSQMDGIMDDSDLLKRAIKWGHKAIAITDHNGIQAFPHVYNTVKWHNKGLKEGETPFKAIYGVELTLVDDTVDIVLRKTDDILLEQTYVVFDFETTGFNAGGTDSIIEAGAVKIHNGEIIDRFDELINPGRPLPSKITEITHITDAMLVDKDNEENAMRRFIDWIGDLPMVAHNAKFDVSFMEMAYKKYNFGEFKNTVIDTLELSRTLDNNFARHSLSALVKRYEIPFDEDAHHRADYDSEATALIFHKMMKKLETRNIEKISDLDKLVSKDEIHKYGRTYHVNLLVKDKVGLKNLFKIVSYANTKYIYKTPRIPRSELEKLREGIFIGSGCYQSEVFQEGKSKSEEELTNIISFYDYVEVQPPECYKHLLASNDFGSTDELKQHLEKIVRVSKEAGKLVVATSDAHHLDPDDKVYREIIVNQKVPGGGRHPLARYAEIPSNHLHTTKEMYEGFNFLPQELAREIIIENPHKIADQVDILEVIIETNGIPFSPKIENSEQEVNDLVYGKAHSMYGEELPEIVKERIEKELYGIIKGGFDVIYLISQKLVKKSNDDGYLVGSRGSVGSSFVATMMGITEVNPLPAHYLCRKCKYSEFDNQEGTPYGVDYTSGYDLPNKVCPKCGEALGKEGQDMPFATFLGFDADKVPDIDLNFSGDYQWKAHEYTKELFGIDNVYRAGTIGTVAEKTAFGFVKGFFEDKGILNVRTAEVERLALGCTGIKRTTGQHPGGIVVVPGYMDVYDFTPYQFPADDPNSLWRTTHFDYHAIDQDLLKLDILGHDDPTMLRMLQDLSGIDVTTLPFDDEQVLSLLRQPDALGVTEEQILCPTGTLGLPELGTRFVIQMLVDTQPKTFGELVKISGLSHGTDVWAGNASELIKDKVVEFKEVIGCRDDIMVSLMNWGVEAKTSFKIMEFVRKGRPTKEPATWKEFAQILTDNKIPEWYIESCRRIKYMFPKAHACAYVMSALRIAWFKVYKPILYYTAYFSVRISDFDIETMIKGYDAIKEKIIELQAKGYEKTNKEDAILSTLEASLEASARGIKFANIDITKSDSKNFVILDEHTLLPPFRTLDGLGENVAKTIVAERENKPFLSKEELQTRGKVSKTLIEKMELMKILDDMPDSNQLSLF